VSSSSDALDRLVVAYESVPTGFSLPQTVVRVFSYNGTAKAFTPLTTSFYPFVNSVPGTPATPSTIRDFRPAVAMTTKQIMVAAKGEINLSNHPELGPDSFTQAAFYTVFSHPDPKEDPTAAATGGDISLSIVRAGNNVTITWTADGVGLETAPSIGVGAVWTSVTTTGKSYSPAPTGTAFYRLKKP